jgi:hypothetical protein
MSMSNEPTGLNFVKKYFETFILCATCQKEDVAEPHKQTEQTELTDSQLNADASNIISSTFDIGVYLEENNPNKNVELTTNPNNLIKPDENISINIDGNNSGYFIKEDYIDKKEENDDDNFEIV